MKAANKVQIEDSTTSTGTSTGKTTSTYYTYADPSPSYKAEKGWECPRCGRINAPWVRQCDCPKNNEWNKWDITWKDDTKPWWYDYKVTCDDTTDNEWWKTSVDTFRIHPEKTATWTSIYDLNVGGSDYKDPVTGDWVNVPTTYTNSVKR